MENLTEKSGIAIGSGELIGFLTGSWIFERELTDHRTDVRGEVCGQADFISDGVGLLWQERGELHFGDFAGPTTRHLRIVPGEHGWQVRFEDGRFFHSIDLGQGHCEADHPCHDDFYSGSFHPFDTAVGPVLETVWRVTGPEKDQLIFTRYRR